MSQMQQNNYGGTNYQVETGKDNTNLADRPELLQKFRPQNPQGCILATSRTPVLAEAGIAEVKHVLQLSRQESFALLMKRS